MRFQDPETGKNIVFNSLGESITDNEMWNYRDTLIDDIREYGDLCEDNYLVVPTSSFALWQNFFIENGWTQLE